MTVNALANGVRTLDVASAFLDEVRREIAKAGAEGMDLPPRLRSIHERTGHATPEFRSFAVPVSDVGDISPEALSKTISRYAATKRPVGLILAFEAVTEDDGGQAQPLLIAEARDAVGTRQYLMQPYRVTERAIDWSEPLNGGWQDPGREEMILDAAFPEASARVRER